MWACMRTHNILKAVMRKKMEGAAEKTGQIVK
jgi:hypothetical protein